MSIKKFLIIGAYGLVLALPLIPNVASADTVVSLYNPLGESDIRVIIGRVIKGILSLIGSIAFLMFVYGGVLWLTSGGRSEYVKKGKDILTWATLGLGVIFASYAAVSAILNALTSGDVSPS